MEWETFFVIFFIAIPTAFLITGIFSLIMTGMCNSFWECYTNFCYSSASFLFIISSFLYIIAGVVIVKRGGPYFKLGYVLICIFVIALPLCLRVTLRLSWYERLEMLREAIPDVQLKLQELSFIQKFLLFLSILFLLGFVVLSLLFVAQQGVQFGGIKK